MSAVMVSLSNHRGRGSRTPFDEAQGDNLYNSALILSAVA
jgi:hypothetical protein